MFRFDPWPALGLCAATLTMFSFIPQITKVIKNKSAQDVSLTTLIQLSLGVTLWIAYGIHLQDTIIITANGVTLATLLILLYLYFTYGRRQR